MTKGGNGHRTQTPEAADACSLSVLVRPLIVGLPESCHHRRRSGGGAPSIGGSKPCQFTELASDAKSVKPSVQSSMVLRAVLVAQNLASLPN